MLRIRSYYVFIFILSQALISAAAHGATRAGIEQLTIEQLAHISSAELDQVRTLDDPRTALQARLDLISQAKKEITLQYYEIENDSFALGGLALLRELAETRGVKIRIIFDNHEMNLPMEYLAAVLRSYQNDSNPNFQIRIYNPFNPIFPVKTLNRRMHDKVMTIDVTDTRTGPADGTGILITGGRNASNGYFDRNAVDDLGQKETQYEDMDLMVRGAIAPQQAKRYFNDLWKNSYVKPLDLGNFSYAGLHPSPSCGGGGERGGDCTAQFNSGNYEKKYLPAEKALEDSLYQMKAGFKFKASDPDSTIMRIGLFTTDEWFAEKSVKVERKATKFVFDPALVANGNSVKKDKTGTATSIFNFIRAHTRKNLTIVTPYLVSTPEHIQLFKELIARGVKITMITNSDVTNDVAFAQAGFEKTAPMLLNMGIKLRVYQGPETLHEKHVMIDMESANIADIAEYEFDQIPGVFTLNPIESYGLVRAILGKTGVRGVFVGSFNWDFRSQNINRETGLLVLNGEDGAGFPAGGEIMDRLLIKLVWLRLHSCAVNAEMQTLGGCTVPRPANYDDIRKTIDQDKGEPGYSLARDYL